MITFVCGVILGWIAARSYRKSKEDVKEMSDDVKSFFGRFTKKDEQVWVINKQQRLEYVGSI